MSPRSVRRAVIAVCVIGIAGMIVTSIAGSNGGALTFGLVTAAAVVAQILVTAVSAPPATGGESEVLAARVEEGIAGLVAAGADEPAVRALVGDAVRLGAERRRESAG